MAVSGHGGPGDKTDGVARRLVGLVDHRRPDASAATTRSPAGSGRDVRRSAAPAATRSRTNRGARPTPRTSSSATTASSTGCSRDGDPTDLDRDLEHRRRTSAATTRSRPARATTSCVGGAGDDTVRAGDGHNIVLGDSGRLTAADADTVRWFGGCR